jgi:hypothetical protein
MKGTRRLDIFAWAGVASLTLTVAAVAAQQPNKSPKDKDQDKDKHPTLKLTARPPLGMSPARVVLTGDLTGGPNDAEDFYCPTVEWDWGDGTTSESSSDCEPYEAGKSEIKRRYSVEHVFRAGNYRVALRLKKRDKMITSATVMVEVRPGIRDL